MWKNLPHEQKEYYEVITQSEMKEYHKKLEEYYKNNKSSISFIHFYIYNY